MKNISPNSKLTASIYHINISSALYSSLLGTVKEYVQSLFPPDFFKSVFVQNSTYSVTAAKNNDDDKMTQDRPNLSLLMNYEPQDDATTNGDSFLYGNMFIMRGAWTMPHIYSRVAWDRNKAIYITSSTSRAKHLFDITMRLNSELQSINVQGMLRQRIGLNRPLFLNKRWLEVPFPPGLVSSIAAAKGYDLKDPTVMTKFNEELTQASDGLITYKLHKSSGKYAYFYKYMVNLLFKVTSYETVDKEVVDKAIVHSSMKMSISVEYTNHTTFIAESYQNLPPPRAEDRELIMDDIGIGVMLHSTFNTPISMQLPTGEKCVFSTNIMTDINEQLDETPIGAHITKEVLAYINHLKEEDPTYELLKLKFPSKLYREGDELEYGKDYEMDWHNLKLVVLLPRSNYNHRFLLYSDIREINDFNQLLHKVENI